MEDVAKQTKQLSFMVFNNSKMFVKGKEQSIKAGSLFRLFILGATLVSNT